MNRSEPGFALELYEFFKNAKWDTKYDFLKYYQNLIRVFFNEVDIDSRGLLCYLSMGMGKSMLAIAIAIDQIKNRPPILLLTKSLQANMRNTIIKYVKLRAIHEPDFYLCAMSDEELSNWIDRRFSFVSMNASNMLKQVSRAADAHSADEFEAVLEKKLGEVLKIASLDGKLLIVDEAHNFFRAITNGSKNAKGLYDIIMRAKNLKILFLTGTPMANDPFELVPCFNMLGSKNGVPILPETYTDFTRLFTDNGMIRNREKFQNRIFGLVSYVSNKSTPGRALGIEGTATKAEFPEERELVIERVNMSPEQYVMYQLARDKEREEGSTGARGRSSNAFAEMPALVKPKNESASTYRVRSRQLSNYCMPAGATEIPDNATSPKFERILANIEARPGQLGLVYSQFTGAGGLGAFAKFLKAHGYTALGKSGGEGPAMPSIDEYLDSLDKVGSADEEFTLDSAIAHGSKTFAIISGDVSVEDRNRIQDIMNAESNKFGGQLDLLLISSTGAEGLDLKNIRHIHIMEPYWNMGRIDQIKARGVRNDSHIVLPADMKNVTPYIYLAIPPTSERLPDGSYPVTTDIELYEESVRNQVSIESFNAALQEVSIECAVNAGEHCRLCAPSPLPLYTTDVFRDIKAADPCRAVHEEKITAQEIVIDGKKYYYVPDPASIYNYKLFIHNEKLDAYQPMDETDPLYASIAASIDEASSA